MLTFAAPLEGPLNLAALGFVRGAVGNYLADQPLNPQPDVASGQILKVIALRHIISTMRSDRVTHNLSVCVKAVPKPEVFT
jgi:hypothetical protein